LRPARSCPWPPRLAWLAGELAMAGGFICNLMLEICDLINLWGLEFMILKNT
jgi:hypothetical protein